jgi:hypothetical protein
MATAMNVVASQVAWSFFGALLFVTTAVRADPLPVTPSNAASRHDVRRDEPRLRLDIAGSAVVSRTETEDADGGGLGLVLDFGLQMNDWAALYVRGEAAAFPALPGPPPGPDNNLGYAAASYVVAELTPQPWFSIGTGYGVDAMHGLGGNGWHGASVPLVVGLNIGGESERTTRTKFRIGFERARGTGKASNGVTGVVGGHTALTLGVAWM